MILNLIRYSGITYEFVKVLLFTWTFLPQKIVVTIAITRQILTSLKIKDLSNVFSYVENTESAKIGRI